MADEEKKAEKYLITFLQKNNVVDILPLKTSWDLRCLLIDVIKYVLSEGRKESAEEIDRLEKEKCELLGIIQGKDKVIDELKVQIKE